MCLLCYSNLMKHPTKDYLIAFIFVAVISFCITITARYVLNEAHNSDNYTKHETLDYEKLKN